MRTESIHAAWCACRECAPPQPGRITQQRQRRFAACALALIITAALIFTA